MSMSWSAATELRIRKAVAEDRARSAATELAIYVPQEYPKMVPGADGPTIVHKAQEELSVLMARVRALTAREPVSPNGSECALPADDVGSTPSRDAIDVQAWVRARQAPQHDWIAALYRPYVAAV